MIDKNEFEVDMVNPEDDSTLNNMTASLGKICGTELLETSIEGARIKKKAIVSKIESVTNLMKEVEYQEKAAEQTKVEAAQIHSEIMLKVHELVDKQIHVKKKNVMLAGEAFVQKRLLSSKTKKLQLHVASLLHKGDRSLELLDEMIGSLEAKLASAMMKKNLAIKKKKENEAFARATLAYEKIQMEKVEEESKRLEQEAVEISKLQEFLIDREHLVNVLRLEISEKCQDAKLLKEELDQVVGFSEADIKKSSHGVKNITRSIKKVKSEGKSRGYRLFSKCIKKVKTKGKLHGNKMLAKSMKKLNMKSKLHGNQICTKSTKKLNPKGKRHGRQICAKIIKRLKIIRHGSPISKNIKNSKIKVKLHENYLCTKSIKKLKIRCKWHGSQICAKNFKKLKIKGKLRESQRCAKSIKKMKIKGKLHGNHLCIKSIKKAKIKQGGQTEYKENEDK